MTQKKVGRNDPCPCGSGKKYKNCHLPLEQETKKTYTPSGKRKFTAKVISMSDKSQSVFQRASESVAQQSAPVNPEELKFKFTDRDFRVKGADEEKPLFNRPESTTPTSQEPISSIPTGEFEPAKEDFRKKEKKE